MSLAPSSVGLVTWSRAIPCDRPGAWSGRHARLLSEVLGLFVRALFAFQRRTARRLGVVRPLPGAVAFVQRFGSAEGLPFVCDSVPSHYAYA